MLNDKFNAEAQSNSNNSPLDRELYNQIANEEIDSQGIKLYLGRVESFLQKDSSANSPDYYELERQRSSLHDYLLLSEENEVKKENVTAKSWFGQELKVSPKELDDYMGSLIEEESLSEDQRISTLTFLSKRWGLSDYQLERFYQAKKSSLEQKDQLDGTRSQLEELLALEDNRLDIREIIPESYAQLVIEYCQRLDFRPEVALTTLLSGLSSCFDYRSQVHLVHQTAFYQPATLYSALVAESGVGKTNMLRKYILNQLNCHQTKAEDIFQTKIAEKKKELAEYKLLGKEEKLDAYPEGEPELPERAKRYYLTESTVEAFARAYKEYPGKTILYASDELNKLFKSLGKYSGGDNGDLEKLIELYDRSPLSIGRAGRDGNIYIPLTGLSIYGGVQPEVLKEIWEDGNDREGKSSRFIYCYQPLNNAQLSLDDHEQVICPLDEKLEFLYGLLLNTNFTTYKLTKSGRRKYIEFFNECSWKNKEADNRFLGHVYSKAKGQCGRLMLNLHAINSIWQPQFTGLSEEIPDSTVEKAIRLSRFYIDQVRLLLHTLCPNDQLTPKLRDIVNLAKSKESITARIVKMNRRQLRDTNPNEIREMFLALENMGYGQIKGTGKKATFSWISPK